MSPPIFYNPWIGWLVLRACTSSTRVEVGPRHVCQPLICYECRRTHYNMPFHYSRPAAGHRPIESPHTTEAEPEVCFIDTEACQARNLNSSHTRMGEQFLYYRKQSLRSFTLSLTYDVNNLLFTFLHKVRSSLLFIHPSAESLLVYQPLSRLSIIPDQVAGLY
jgi:hypothetical protein